MRTFWTRKSYMVGKERWHWIGAVLEINMLNAMERVACMPIKELDLVEHSDKHWKGGYYEEKFDQVTTYEVWMQEEMPILTDPEHTVITDHRPKDRFWLDKEAAKPPRPGFKTLPMEFRF